MNIHEYQAKQLFKEYGVPVQDGVAAKSEAEFVLDKLIAFLEAGDMESAAVAYIAVKFINKSERLGLNDEKLLSEIRKIGL